LLKAVPWGRVSGPAGLAPEALQERECSCRVFFARPSSVRGVLFQPTSAMFQPASVHHAHTSGAFRVRCSLGGVAVRRAPEPGPVRGDWVELSDLHLYAPSPSLHGTGRGVRSPQPPSIGSQIADSSSSCYRVIQVDAHAPFDKGWLVVWRLVHGSACVGLLGGARSRSLGTEGAEALP
jgi:hypothetical protein